MTTPSRTGTAASSQFSRPLVYPDVEKQIFASVDAAVRQEFGIQGTMPEDLTLAVEQASRAAAQTAVDVTVAKLAQDAARNGGRQGVLDRFQDNLSFAATGMQVIDTSNDVDTVLARRASLLAKKRDALVQAGFTALDALQILLADINARG